MVNPVPTSLGQRLSTVERVVGSPFAPSPFSDGFLAGGPDHHLVVLAMSRDFWEDRSTEVVEAAEEEIEARGDELTAALDARWGPHSVVDLRPWEDVLLEGGAVAEPFASLLEAFRDLRVWRLPGSGLWFGLTLVQHDPELEIMLVGVVGGESALAPPAAEPPPGEALPPTGWSPLPRGLMGL